MINVDNIENIYLHFIVSAFDFNRLRACFVVVISFLNCLLAECSYLS